MEHWYDDSGAKKKTILLHFTMSGDKLLKTPNCRTIMKFRKELVFVELNIIATIQIWVIIKTLSWLSAFRIKIPQGMRHRIKNSLNQRQRACLHKSKHCVKTLERTRSHKTCSIWNLTCRESTDYNKMSLTTVYHRHRKLVPTKRRESRKNI